MKEQKEQARARLVIVFGQRPERVAAAWRQAMAAEPNKAPTFDRLLDGMVESFIREIGETLGGARGSTWGRTRGVFKISRGRGVEALYEEFWALRRCLLDAAEALGGGDEERETINAVLDEAVECAAALYQQMDNPQEPPPAVPFGGVVVESFERAQPGVQPERSPELH